MMALLPCTRATTSSTRFLVSFISTIVSLMFILLIVSVSFSWASAPAAPDRRSNEVAVGPHNQMPEVSYQHHQELQQAPPPPPQQQHSKDSFVPLAPRESRESLPTTFYEPNYMQQTNSLASSSSGDVHNSLQSSQQQQQQQPQQDESMESNFDQVRRSFQTSHEQYSDILGLMMKDLEQRIQQQQQQQPQLLQQSQQLQQQQPSLVPPASRLSNLGAFAAMNGGGGGGVNNNYGEDPSKLGTGSIDQLSAGSSSSAALQYPPRPGMFPGMMPMTPPMPGGAFPPAPGAVPPAAPFLGPFGDRRNTLLNPFMNPAFGSEYPFFPYNPIFSKLHTNPYLFSYMPYYPAPYGPGRYYQQRQKLQQQAHGRKADDVAAEDNDHSRSASLASTLLAVANYLTTPREYETMAAEPYVDRAFEVLSPSIVPPPAASPLLSLLEEAAAAAASAVDATTNTNTNMLDDSLQRR